MSGMCKPHVTIIVATHKEYQMPKDEMYLPLHVGAEGKTDMAGNPLDLGYIKDNTGENISRFNSSFCELTGLYWAWKSLDEEYIGLVHYRRHFSLKKIHTTNSFDNVLTYQQIYPYLGNIRIFVPNKRRYYIETLYSHYAHTHYSSQLDETRKVIGKKYPQYLNSFDFVVNQRYGYMFNMMIMQNNLLDQYCAWLFDILFELETRINGLELSAFQGRCYGRISEIIFNVWLDYQIRNKKLRKEEIMEIPVIYMEKVNWWKKGSLFLAAKFLGRKYNKSF